MKKRILSILLSICLLTALFSITVSAASYGPIIIEGVGINDTGYYGVSNLDTSAEDTATLAITGDTKGYIHWDKNNLTLTLYGVTIGGKGIQGGQNGDYVFILADGKTNNITSTSGDAIAITWGSLIIGGDGTINVTGAKNGIYGEYTVSITENVTANITGNNGMGIVNDANTRYDGVVIEATATANISGSTYGIGTDGQAKAPDIQSLNVTVKGGTAAFEDATKPSFAAGIGAKASSDINGTNPEDYNSSKNSTYKWFKSIQLSSYNVKYLPGTNGTGSEASDTKIEGTDLTLKNAIFTREGYTQTGWATSDGGAKVYGLGAKYTANEALTLYPVWSLKTYTVKYFADGNLVDTQTVEHGNDAVAPTIPAKEGYDVTSPTWDKDGKNIKADTEINAVYTANKYTVKYFADGNLVDTQTVEYGTDAAAPTIPAKEGYDKTAPTWDKDGKNIKADTEINAVYTVNKYTVKYFADGNLVDTQNVEYGKDAVAPTIPAKEGYDKTAPTWDKDGKNIKADTEINAVYKINEYTIKFMDESGVYKTLNYKHGESVTMPEVPEKDGYTVKWEKTIDKAVDDVTIKAVYTEIVKEEIKEDDKKEEDKKEEDKKDPNVPTTSDNNFLWLWTALMLISALSIFRITLCDSKAKRVIKR